MSLNAACGPRALALRLPRKSVMLPRAGNVVEHPAFGG
jgi:hypothetical protein